MEKTPRKVKVYGLDSTKNVRARLIEILMERSMYHKDKFIAPILWEEMRAMEVKKSGKVEHSDKTHDDNVFSYLMALYVWYDGKNLVENFNLRKTTLRTDDNQDIEEVEFEEALEAREKVDFRSATFEFNEEISKELEWIESDKLITSNDIESNQYIEKINKRQIILGKIQNDSNDNDLPLGVTIHSITNPQYPGYSNLPNSIYDLDDDYTESDFDTTIMNHQEYHVPLAGNLAKFYDKV